MYQLFSAASSGVLLVVKSEMKKYIKDYICTEYNFVSVFSFHCVACHKTCMYTMAVCSITPTLLARPETCKKKVDTGVPKGQGAHLR